jgi:hypothetical protein
MLWMLVLLLRLLSRSYRSLQGKACTGTSHRQGGMTRHAKQHSTAGKKVQQDKVHEALHKRQASTAPHASHPLKHPPSAGSVLKIQMT